MLLKKITWFRKGVFTIISTMLLFGIIGCSNVPQEESSADEAVSEVPILQQDGAGESEIITKICLDLYEKAAEENKAAELETIRSIVNRFGANGYPAVDSRNQINMTEAEQVVRFCEQVAAGEEAEITIIEITYTGGFVQYDLQTKDGKVDVVRNYYGYENGAMMREGMISYQADHWNYTKEGYLMFSGSWFSELYGLTLSGTEENTAFRVQPLDESYRELNRKYLLPIGYGRNNMFLTDWSEEDFGELDFYDIFDIFYPQIAAAEVPYVADDNSGVGVVYQIPKDEFEGVIMTYFNIDSEMLQSKTTYDSEAEVYEYRPRGFYEVEYPEYPYSEVAGYSENSDGTITLIVHVVFPHAGDSKVYAHEVVVRPLEDGRIQYVSNRIIQSNHNREGTWHTPRLTEEEWEEIYGGQF